MSTAVAERTLPHNLEAERAILGAILVDTAACDRATETLAPPDFYRDAHARIFEAMLALSAARSAIDLVTLKEALARAGALEEVGGPVYISSLVDGVPRSINVAHYARIVKEKATLRRLIFAANKILGDAYEAEENADTVLDAAEQAVFAVAEDRLRDGFVGMDRIVRENFATVEALFEQKRLITGAPSGFVDLDEKTRGFQPGDLVIIAARPSMGKTSLVLNIAQHVALHGTQPVGFFSLEMSKEALFLRLLTAIAQIDGHRLMTGHLGAKDYGRLAQALEMISAMRLYIDDAAQTVLEMRAKARRLQAERGLSLLVIDYVQLMTHRGRYENRTLELGAISRALKGLAKELRVPVIVLSQLSRAPETRADHRPQLSDLRESGALEQDADVVVLIYRDDVYRRDADNPDVGIAELIVAKQRNGPTGTVRLAFIREQTRFANLAT